MKSIEEYIPLPLGRTFTRWDLPLDFEDSTSSTSPLPILLLIHGATVPGWGFDSIVPELFRRQEHPNQYRVLRLDLYGHGQSARPNVKYDLGLFVTQVLNVIEHCQCCNGSNHIIGMGHSLGSAVLAKVASSKPTLFHRLILIAPMIDYKSLNPVTRVLSVPIVGETLMRNMIIPYLKKRRLRRYGSIGRKDLGERFINEIEGSNNSRSPGEEDDDEISFSEMLLRMFRDGTVEDQTNVYEQLSESRHQHMTSMQSVEDPTAGMMRIHVIWGSRDTTASEKQIIRILCLLGRTERSSECDEMDTSIENSGISFIKLNGLEHNLLLSHPKVCVDEIVRFLSM